MEIKKRFTTAEVWIAGMTHDSCYGYIPIGYTKERLKEMKYIMENLPIEKNFGWKPQVPFIVDAETSLTNMAELKGIDLS